MFIDRAFWPPTLLPLRAKVNGARCIALGFLALLCVLCARPAQAVTLLRDAGMEYGLGQISAPILQAAGLSPNRVRVLIIDDSSFNAFVIDRSTIFIHSGLIAKSKDVEVLQAVIAHEAGHIANGHIVRRNLNMANARTVAGLGSALGLIAATAGGGEAAAGLAIGIQSSATRSFLGHTRAEESAADRAAADYLRRAGIGAQGLINLHETFKGQEVLSVGRQDPYMQSHPLTRDRIRAAEAYVAANGAGPGPSDNDRYWFARVKGTLTAFDRSPKWTLARAAEEPWPDVTKLREAIAWHQNRNLPKALAAIDAAIAIRPQDPFYRDLKGQILLENRQWSAALAAYGKAVNLDPGDALLRGDYGRALLANKQYKDAQIQLEKSVSLDPRNPPVLRDLGQAYSRLGQNGMASLVTAERYALAGRLDDAEIHARRAYDLLPKGSAASRRADDILIAAKQSKKRK